MKTHKDQGTNGWGTGKQSGGRWLMFRESASCWLSMNCATPVKRRLSLCTLSHLQASWPRQRFYWGYIWDGTGNRVTAPIRNTRNKSHMPASQVRVHQTAAT